MAIRITCINKAGGQHYDPHVAITNLGWVNDSTGEMGKSTRQAVYDWLQNSTNQAYVRDGFGNVAYLGTRENQHGTQIRADLVSGSERRGHCGRTKRGHSAAG